MADVTVKVNPRGPLVVIGEFSIVDSEGNVLERKERASFCRCGASTRKPYCDGTHSRVGFEAAEAAVPESKE